MKVTVGFWDKMFGKKVTLEVPNENGSILKRTVSKKWMDDMVDEGKISIETGLIRVHLLDPYAEGGYKVVYWTIGEDVRTETAERFKDPETGDLYALIAYENGEGTTVVLKKEMYEETREKMQNIE